MPGKLNPSLGAGFTDNRFGEGSITVKLTAEGIKAFTENAQVDGKILIKFNKVTDKGDNHYFIDLLPPYVKKTGTGWSGKTGAGKFNNNPARPSVTTNGYKKNNNID